MKKPKLPEDWLLQRMPENTWNVTGHIVSRNEAVAMVKGEEAAKAIAALPDLLAALEGILARAPHMDRSATHDGIENCKALGDCRSALIKAGYTF